MRRRVISLLSVAIAVVALGLVLYNATLVDRRPPSVAGVSLSAPVEGQPGVGLTLTAIDIQFSEPVRESSVERRFTIEPYVAGTFTWDAGTTAIFTPSQNLPPDTEFTISIRPGFEDHAGNVASTGLEAWSFRTVGPPAVVESDPVDGAEDVPVDATVTLRFDRLMDTGSVEGALRIEPAVPVRPTWSGRDVTLAFDEPLEFGTTYEVSIGTAAAATDGSRLRERFVTRFTTVSAGLRVSAVVPANGVAGISVRSPIAVIFDRPIDPESIEGALRITPPVEGDVRVVELEADTTARLAPGTPRPAGNVLLFTPSAPLAAHTTYTVTLEPVVRRLGGDDVAADRTWSFTTGQPTPSGQNQVAFLSDRGGVRNVWLMNPDGTNPRQLTTELVPVSAFDASADGSMVAWAAAGRVSVMSIDGSGATVITPNDRFEYAPRFVPDGRHLVIARRAGDGTDLGHWLVPRPGVLDATERQLVAEGAPPLGSSRLRGERDTAEAGRWASRVAFDGAASVALLATADGLVRLVDLSREPDDPDAVRTLGLVAEAGPVWSPRDERFALVARSRGSDEPGVWLVDRGGRTERLGPGEGWIAAAADGRLAFLVVDAAGATHVAIRASRASAVTDVLTDGSTFDDHWPSFAPDGTSLLFGRVARSAPGRPVGIWRVDLASGAISQLAPDGAFARWLP